MTDQDRKAWEEWSSFQAIPMCDLEAVRMGFLAGRRSEQLELRGTLKMVKSWCELNKREGSVIYKPVCAALAR